MRRALPPITAGRFSVNLSLRFVYPFLPVIARGLGVSLGAAGVSLSIRELSGLAGPAVGRALDRRGHRLGMLVGLVGVALGCMGGGLSPGLVVFTLAMVVVAVCQLTYNAALTAWVSDRVPYRRRGRALGLTELAWAGALLLGVPLVGVTIDLWGWRAPFFAVAGLNLLLAVALPRFVTRDAGHGRGERRRVSISRPGAALYLTLALQALAVQVVFVVYGAWLEDAFGFSVASIGLASILVGTSELVGSASTVVLTDRLGKRRSVLAGTVVMLVPLCLLGWVGHNVALGLALLSVMLLGFEFGFVSSQPLVTELTPESRGASIGIAYAVVTVARSLGNVAGALTYTSQGIGAVGLIGAVAVVAAIALLVFSVEEPRRPSLNASSRQ